MSHSPQYSRPPIPSSSAETRVARHPEVPTVHEPEAAAFDSSGRIRRFQHVVLALAIGLRVVEYLRKNSLWGDEAMLALNILTRSFHDLLRPLFYAQVAPVPFLWAERVMTQAFGVNEWSLRAVPLAAGAGLCVATIAVARRLLRADEALVALVLVGFSAMLIRYSGEVKPYSLDALLSVTLVGSTAHVMSTTENKSAAWGLLALLGAIAILCSLPSIFVCVGVGVALTVDALRQARLDLLSRICLLEGMWAAVFAVGYTQLYREGAHVPYMRSFWEGAFLVPGSPELAARASVALSDVAWSVYPGMSVVGLGGLTYVMIAVGALALWLRGKAAYVFLLLMPLVASFIASACGWYPIAMRLMLFSAPLLLLLAAPGITSIGVWIHKLTRVVPLRWVVTFLLLPAIITALVAVLEGRDQQMRPLVQRLFRDWRSADAVYVFHRVVPAWLFYSTDWRVPDRKQLHWAMRVSGPGGLGHENGPSRGPRPAGEGTHLTYNLEGRPVLLGVSSGVQGRPMFGYLPKQPDAGWATNESRRICRAAPRAWVIVGNASHEGTDLGDALLQALIQQGGVIALDDAIQDGRLYRVECPREKPR